MGGTAAPPAGKWISGHYDAYNRQLTTTDHHRWLLYHAAPQRLRHGRQHPQRHDRRRGHKVLRLHESLVARPAHERDGRRHDEGHSLRRPDPDERRPVLRQPGHVLQRQGLYLHVDEGTAARLRDGRRQERYLHLRYVRCPHQQNGRRHDVQLHHALRQRQHHGEQPFGFQGQPRVAQVVVGHYRIVGGFLNTKYRHINTSLRRSGKVFVFGEKTASILLGHPGGENLWAGGFRLTVGEKTWDFRLLSCQF